MACASVPCSGLPDAAMRRVCIVPQSGVVMSVRAKFRVHKIERSLMFVRDPASGKHEQREGSTIHLSPVTGGSEENDSFYYYTPTGSIQLGTINEDAATQFPLGADLYVEFT